MSINSAFGEEIRQKGVTSDMTYYGPLSDFHTLVYHNEELFFNQIVSQT